MTRLRKSSAQREREALWLLGTSGQKGAHRGFPPRNEPQLRYKRQRHNGATGVAGQRPGSTGIPGSFWPLHEDEKLNASLYIDQIIGAEIFPAFPNFPALQRQ